MATGSVSGLGDSGLKPNAEGRRIDSQRAQRPWVPGSMRWFRPSSDPASVSGWRSEYKEPLALRARPASLYNLLQRGP